MVQTGPKGVGCGVGVGAGVGTGVGFGVGNGVTGASVGLSVSPQKAGLVPAIRQTMESAHAAMAFTRV